MQLLKFAGTVQRYVLIRHGVFMQPRFNPLNPNIKIQILICYPYTFSIEEVGRICLSIN